MAWHIVERLIDTVESQSTLLGKYWTTFFFTLRFLLIVSIAYPVFDSERDEFTCNTLTPGCESLCFNEFNPMSLLRLWQLQVLSAATQAIIFAIYLSHKSNKLEESKEKYIKAKKFKKFQKKRKKLEDAAANKIDSEMHSTNRYEDTLENPSVVAIEDSESEEDSIINKTLVASKMNSFVPPKILLLYVTQIVSRLSIEIIFIYIQFTLYVYKFWVPKVYKCTEYPCKDIVHCYIGRSYEKTALIWIMFSMTLVMIIFSLSELIHIGKKNIIEAWSLRKEDFAKTQKPNSVNKNKKQETEKREKAYTAYYD